MYFIFKVGRWVISASHQQGCQMACFQTKIPIRVNIGGSCNGRCWYMLWPFALHILLLFSTFWSFAIFNDHLVHLTFWHVVPRKIQNKLTFVLFYCRLVYFMVFGIFPCFGLLYQEKTGNPGHQNGCRINQILLCKAHESFGRYVRT
jgi:hypothetical protein